MLPFSFVESVLKVLHGGMGHPSKDRTMSFLHGRFFRPEMFADTESLVKNVRDALEESPKQT